MAKFKFGDKVMVLRMPDIPSEWQGLKATVMAVRMRASVTRPGIPVLPPQDQWEPVYDVQTDPPRQSISVRESWLSPVKSK